MPHRYSARDRANIFAREKNNAALAGRGRLPICVHCDLPVDPLRSLWDVAHVGAPRCFGGKRVGIGHHGCNSADGRKVTADYAKSNRVHARHIGAAGPGLGRAPMAAGRRSGISRTMDGGLKLRRTGAQKHAAMCAALALHDADGAAVGLWAPAEGGT
jgi:hypothetical protein